ncbi:MAG: peptidoglycan editing factor PgeF [Candidatus Neomarinimicrobiota bacterium]|nr:MAG: peptidoglycan editing factor PgeF [Candidatus Neomarinimicrobiota bacterium]
MTYYVDYSAHFSAPALKAGFSYRTCPEPVRQVLARSLDLDPEGLIVPHQMHSNRVLWVDRPGPAGEADGVFTRNRNAVCSIQVADCLPILLYHPDGVIGAVHAGWRGLAGGILPAALTRLREQGLEPSSVEAVIGPSICGRHFEIGEEIRDRFPPEFVQEQQGRLQVDLKGMARAHLQQEGVPHRQIYVDPACTWEETGRYFSYRREGQEAGRMIGIIGWRNPGV